MNHLKTNKSWVRAFAVAAVLAVTACSEYDNDFTPGKLDFNKSFQETYGTVDPQQDWNMANRGNVTVFSSRERNLLVYTQDEGGFTLVGAFQRVVGEKLLEFDMEAGVKYVVVSDGERNWRTTPGGFINFDDGSSYASPGEEPAADGAETGTRAVDVNRNEYEKKGYILPGNITESERQAVAEAFSTPHNGAVNTVEIPWEDFWVQHVYTGQSSYTDNQQNPQIVRAREHMDQLRVYNKGVNPWGYSYEDKNMEHVNDFNATQHNASYFNPQSGTQIVGTTLMYNLDNSEMYGRDLGNGSRQVMQFAYHNSTDSKFHYEYILKVVNGCLYLGFDFYADGNNPNQQVERDWVFDDWIIKISPAVASELSEMEQDALDIAPVQAWTLAAEDLGTTGDVDYNDVVVKVEHKAGEEYATVTPLAAGGTLASYLFFGDECVGEIHQLFGVEPAVSGQYSTINVGARSITNVSPIRVRVGANWTIACYSTTEWNTETQRQSGSTNMGGFSIRVLPAGTEAREKKILASDPVFFNSQVSVIQGPERGTAPLIICLPFAIEELNTPEPGMKTRSAWKWPNENVCVTGPYPDFNLWVIDKTKGNQWFISPASIISVIAHSDIPTASGIAGVFPMVQVRDDNGPIKRLAIPVYAVKRGPDNAAITQKYASVTVAGTTARLLNPSINLRDYVSSTSDGNMKFTLMWDAGKITNGSIFEPNAWYQSTVNVKVEQEATQDYKASTFIMTVNVVPSNVIDTHELKAEEVAVVKNSSHLVSGTAKNKYSISVAEGSKSGTYKLTCEGKVIDNVTSISLAWDFPGSTSNVTYKCASNLISSKTFYSNSDGTVIGNATLSLLSKGVVGVLRNEITVEASKVFYLYIADGM